MSLAANFSRPRHFNRLHFGENHVTKTIFDKKRGRQEIFFYRNVPTQIASFFPSLNESIERAHSMSYKMSRIACPDVARLYLSHKLTPLILKQLLKQIDLFWQKAPQITATSARGKNTLSQMTIDKLQNRWTEYQKTNNYQSCFRYFIKNHLLDLQILKNELCELLKEEIAQSSTTKLTLSHGDLCFSNTFLVSPQKVMFVDPRGGTQYNELYIPQVYDLAKLSQCIYGNYDGILANKTVSFSPQKELFTKWLQQKQISFRLLRLIEASHFLSLLPLHQDKPKLHIPFIYAALRALQEAP